MKVADIPSTISRNTAHSKPLIPSGGDRAVMNTGENSTQLSMLKASGKTIGVYDVRGQLVRQVSANGNGTLKIDRSLIGRKALLAKARR
jgi:hypothetical protein